MVQEQSSSHHQQLPKYGSGTGAATGVARASKKNKPKKIPQRGLGVAQLEKLRIEEQKKMEGAAVSGTAHAAHSHALSGGGLGHLLPLRPPPPPVPLSALPIPAADGGVHCGFLPVLWDPADPMKHPHKRSLCQQHPLPVVSTGLSLTASSSHPKEPPSNQMYSSSGSRSSAATPAPAPAEEDREAASVDRTWPFMFEGMTTAAFRTTGKGTPAEPIAARAMREAGFADVCPDQSRFEFRATNYFSTKANYSDWASDFAHYKNSKESGCAGEPALLALSAQRAPLIKQPHVIPSLHLPEYNDFSLMRSQQGSISASSSRPFYSFLPAGPVRCEGPLSECKADVSDGVDLELKLWKS
ncbi:protein SPOROCYTELESS [Phragmites australis]|uniref:protein SPOROCYTELESS n=1 Tax=Phragmites australis TaxID=29695 RepID=UPI002D79DD5B|nr:protein SPOROCYTELESS [Phragmites australis]